MPSLEQKKTDNKVRMMLMGHSGAGKTGALVSLVEAGYSLRIYDFDFGLDILLLQIKARCPDRLSAVQYMEFRDHVKMSASGPRVDSPKAFVNAVNALDKWEDGTKPQDWDDNTVVVIDSLTAMGRAAFYLARSMNPLAKEPRTWYYAAQDLIESVIGNLTDEDFHPHVVVNTHIDERTQADGSVQGFPSAIGKSLGPKIPRYFNNLILLETSGMGQNVSRRLRTLPTATVGSVKVPIKADATLPIESGLATLFEKIRGSKPTV